MVESTPVPEGTEDLKQQLLHELELLQSLGPKVIQAADGLTSPVEQSALLLGALNTAKSARASLEKCTTAQDETAPETTTD